MKSYFFVSAFVVLALKTQHTHNKMTFSQLAAIAFAIATLGPHSLMQRVGSHTPLCYLNATFCMKFKYQRSRHVKTHKSDSINDTTHIDAPIKRASQWSRW